MHSMALVAFVCDTLLRYKTGVGSDNLFMAVVVMAAGARIVEAIEK